MRRTPTAESVTDEHAPRSGPASECAAATDETDATADADGRGAADGGTDAGRADRRRVGGHLVRGVAVDAETRCGHYDTDRDVIAIRFACCGEFHPCHACHDARADHDAATWPRSRFDEQAVLCGACGRTLSVAAYLDCEHACPSCGHAFNPGCAAHADRYFDV